MLSSKLFSLLPCNLPVHIDFIADEYFNGLFIGVLLSLFLPLSHGLQALLIGDIKDKHDNLGALVVGRDDGFELVLAGRVPHKQLDCLFRDGVGSELEVDSDGRLHILVEDVVGVAQQDAGLAD